MSFALLAYAGTVDGSAAPVDVPALLDPEFTARIGVGANPHYIFTESWSLLAAIPLGATMTRATMDVPTINAISPNQLWPINQGTTIPSRPPVIDYRDYPMALPRDEEIAVNVVNGAAEATKILMFIGGPGFNRNVPRGIQRVLVRAAYTITAVADVWTGPGTLTFAQQLKGGRYAVVGAHVFDAGVVAFRLLFPNSTVEQGRRLRPGGLAQNAVADVPWPAQRLGMGVWGEFNSFEPPTIEILANGAGATTGVVMLDLVYLGG